MKNVVESVLNGVDSFLIWLSASLKQTMESYSELETADSPNTLVAHDGSLITVLEIRGTKGIIGAPEFDRIHQGVTQTLQTAMSRPGQTLQAYFNYDKDGVMREIEEIYKPAEATAAKLNLQLKDLFRERKETLGSYCAKEEIYFVLWTRPNGLSKEQFQRQQKEKLKFIKEKKIPPFKNTQNLIAAITDLREAHDSFVRAIINDVRHLGIYIRDLEVHHALRMIRKSIDPDFTEHNWRPILPGDSMMGRDTAKGEGDIADLLWPPLAKQILPRDAENIDLRTVRVGDKIYAPMSIELFPKDIKTFISLFSKTLQTRIPWRMSFLIESDSVKSIRLKSTVASVLSFSSEQNRLLSDSNNLLNYLRVNTDDAVVRLQVALCTWAPADDIRLLRTRAAELAKALEGWGADISEVSGDAFAGLISTALGISGKSVAPAAIAPLKDVVFMLPLMRPASPWDKGALLFRTPDGKPWPFQPGSSQQTTWIDLFYARPGSGKSVLSNAVNLALCLSGGILRLPHIAIVDIGPSSSGLISLLREALPREQRHFVAYHRLRMTEDYAINPFDTQLGCRYPTPQERAFLVNFLTLLATPLGAERPYDGISDMSGLIIDELYKTLADNGNPYTYTQDLEPLIDGILEEIGFVRDKHTTWWEVTDALFAAGFIHEAKLAQRYAMPLLADAASICRTPVISDLYSKITAPTGENLVAAFSRMISSSVREYPILSRITRFDIGDARIVSLDLDEVAKSGGEAADRQTAVMYMLARYVLARHYYLTEDNVNDMPEQYRDYQAKRIAELREDPKRIVYDEFHRTAKAQAVRDQVLIDMREGRKWKVQIALLSQSVDDFDEVMVEFATAIYILDAGPSQAVKKTAEIFGLSETAVIALKNRVHGPREGGATFLAQFATKEGVNTQLLTATLGPVELWAFSTTVEDVKIRNELYKQLGPTEARRLLSTLFPGGSITKIIDERLADVKEQGGLITEDSQVSVVDDLIREVLVAYSKDPEIKRLSV